MIKVFDVLMAAKCSSPKRFGATQVLRARLNQIGTTPNSLPRGDRLHERRFFCRCAGRRRTTLRIDPIPARGACAFGIVLLKLNRLDESEKVFRSYIQQHGEEGSILTNLAKVYSARNDHQKAEEILWHGLEVDPNQITASVGMPPFTANVAAKQRAGRHCGGWPGCRAVGGRNFGWPDRLASPSARKSPFMYQECLARAAKPVPADLLTQMSGDLGNAGHLPQICNWSNLISTPKRTACSLATTSSRPSRPRPD